MTGGSPEVFRSLLIFWPLLSNRNWRTDMCLPAVKARLLLAFLLFSMPGLAQAQFDGAPQDADSIK